MRGEKDVRPKCDARDCTMDPVIRCNKCGTAKYCSTSCLKSDWDAVHRRMCSKDAVANREKQRNQSLVYEPVLATSTESDKATATLPYGSDNDVVDPRGVRYFENVK
jgi:hypothetical protein